MTAVEDGDREVLRAAWKTFCESLHEEGSAALDGATVAPESAQELAEALRSVARMGILALQHRMDFWDPDFPVFFRSMDDRYRYGGPDINITYLYAPVRGDGTYRITGNHRGRELNLGPLWSDRLTTGADDGFEVIASAHEHEGNWLPLQPGSVSGEHVPDVLPMSNSGSVGGRFYNWDPDDRTATELAIERIDDDAPLRPTPLSPRRLADQISNATELMTKSIGWWLTRGDRIRAEHTPNVVGSPGTRPPGIPGWEQRGTDDGPLNYGVCCWELDADQALIIESELPEVTYWSFQVYTPWWEAPDNQHLQTTIGHVDAHLDSDGRFRAVIAGQDPGVPNWLDTAGHHRGFLFYRWLRPTSPMPTPLATLVPLEEVRNHLPDDHPTVSPEQRRAALARRSRWLASRFQR